MLRREASGKQKILLLHTQILIKTIKLKICNNVICFPNTEVKM